MLSAYVYSVTAYLGEPASCGMSLGTGGTRHTAHRWCLSLALLPPAGPSPQTDYPWAGLQSSLFYSLFFCSFKNLPFICFSLNIFTTFSLFKFRINSVLYFPPTLLCDSLIMLFLFPLSFPPSLVLYGSSSQTWIFLNNTLI